MTPIITVTRWLFGANAIINWAISVRGIVDPVGYAQAFGVAAGDLAFLVRLWMALVFMFGILFWEVSRDPRGKAALAKYNWIEKTITATAVTWGFAAGQVPAALMWVVVATNWVWIPFLLWNDVELRRAKRRWPSEPHTGGPAWATGRRLHRGPDGARQGR